MSVQVKQRRTGGPWYVYTCHDNKEKWTHVGSEAAAKAVATKVETKIALQELGFLEPKKKRHFFKEAVEVYQAEFLKKIEAGKKKHSTLERYDCVLKNDILPWLGTTDVDTVTKKDVYSYLVNSGWTNSKIELSLTVLNSVFVVARWHEWTSNNPLDGVRKKLDLTNNSQEVEIFTYEEIKKILAASDGLFNKVAYVTGCRLGELLALEWKDLDFENCTMSITKSFRAGRVTPPKSKNSIRKICLPSKLITTMKQRRGIGLVFSNNGKHIHQNTARSRWQATLKRAGVEYRCFHTTRHTSISHLLAAGVPLIDVSRQAGHHTASFTLNKYGHAIPKKGAISEKLEAHG